MSEQAVRNRRGVVPTFSLERCKRCGICSHMCPTGAIAPDADGVPRLVDPDACTACRLCEHICPDFAVSMVDPEDAGGGGGGNEDAGGEDRHPPNAPEVCHPFGACDG